MTEVTLQFLSRQIERVLDGQRKIQGQLTAVNDQLTVLTAIALKHQRRLEQRITDLEDRHDQP
jgi:hypothetical protein